MSSIPSPQTPPSLMWQLYSSCVVPSIASGLSIIVPYDLFVSKTYKQLEQIRPETSFKASLVEGCKNAPLMGAMIGVQVISQDVLEAGLNRVAKRLGLEMQEGGNLKFAFTIVSSAAVGIISAPLCALFNARTSNPNISLSGAFKNLSLKQIVALSGRETSFLLSLKINGPINDILERRFGKSKTLEYISAGIGGASSSLCGQVFDTAFTRLQHKLPIHNPKLWMLGAPQRTLALVGFALFYKFFKELFTGKVTTQS